MKAPRDDLPLGPPLSEIGRRIPAPPSGAPENATLHVTQGLGSWNPSSPQASGVPGASDSENWLRNYVRKRYRTMTQSSSLPVADGAHPTTELPLRVTRNLVPEKVALGVPLRLTETQSRPLICQPLSCLGRAPWLRPAVTQPGGLRRQPTFR